MPKNVQAKRASEDTSVLQHLHKIPEPILKPSSNFCQSE